jgi:hypothetical protein
MPGTTRVDRGMPVRRLAELAVSAAAVLVSGSRGAILASARLR